MNEKVKSCPECGLISPESAQKCQCGHEFPLIQRQESSPREKVEQIQKAREKAISHTQLWLRGLARLIDIKFIYVVVGIPLNIVTYSTLRTSGYLDRLILSNLISMLPLFVWVFVETLLLSTWGTTPGKWILKISVRDALGQKLTFLNAFIRSFTVWWRGLGIGFPIATIITLIVTYSNFAKDGITRWDRSGGFVVSHRSISFRRIVLTILFLLVALYLIENVRVSPTLLRF